MLSKCTIFGFRQKSLLLPVSSDGDGETIILFSRILHARHLGVDGESVSCFTVELLQERKRKMQQLQNQLCHVLAAIRSH